MRLRKRPQGRIPIRLKETQWEIQVYTTGETRRWHGTSLAGLHRWLLEIKPEPTNLVDMWRNGNHIYHGTWEDLAGDPTLW